MILANGCNITKSEKFKGVWILSVPTVYIYIYAGLKKNEQATMNTLDSDMHWCLSVSIYCLEAFFSLQASKSLKKVLADWAAGIFDVFL